ncbi:hypothetical protein, partial [Clostridioides difficile]|uniref:hypothetical protein n=1 Tax=Clostridioides difficile TaxID=1496 RepID=UPI0020B1B2AE
ESDDVAKNADAVLDMEVVYSKTEIIEQDAIPAKQVNMVFGGTDAEKRYVNFRYKQYIIFLTIIRTC